MKILSFSRMKACRKDGRILAILKLRLPRIDGEDAILDAFNSFYLSLAEAYSLAISKADGKSEGYVRPVSVTVDFEVVEENNSPSGTNLLTVKRTVSVNEDGKIKRTERRDVYDLVRGIFVK